MKNWHTTPFEMVEIWLEMKLPIFVARQFVRHRTVTINEVSGRYVTLPAEWYTPEIVGGKATNVKQGQADNLDEPTQRQFRGLLGRHCKDGYDQYTHAISNGVAPEHARMFLSLNHYTHWMWKQDLHNMMHFLSLRTHSHAQVEAQAYANVILQLLRTQLPHSMALFDEYRKFN
jgi:thymidylate synthase (FAD)